MTATGGNPGGTSGPAGEPTLLDILAVLRRYRLLLVGCLLLGFGLAVAMLAWLDPVYRATAQLLIEPSREQAEDLDLSAPGIAADDAAIDSQVKLLASRSMAREVIEALGLDGEPELQRPLAAVTRLSERLGAAPAAAGGDDPSGLVDQFLGRLSVARDGRSHVIDITFASSDPRLASRIANGVANRYIAGRLGAKSAASGVALAWLERALDDSRQTLRAAEAALAAFRLESRADYPDTFALHGVDLVNLRRDLAAAAADRAAREARLRRIRSVLDQAGDDLAFEELGGSAVLQNLYALKNQTTRREAELKAHYGERHPRILDIRAEREELEWRILAEQRALLRHVEAEIAAARARETTLEGELDRLKRQSMAQSDAEARMADLERAVERARRQHDAYLERFQAAADAVEKQRADARLISEATPPQRPSFPQPLLVFGLFSMASLGTGLLLVFFVEQTDRGFRTQRATSEALGRRSLGCLPLVPRRRRGGPLHVVDLPLDRPTSHFAESLRALLTELTLRLAKGSGRVVLVTSATPGEGKSTTTLALARLAASEGLKVLAIDADMRCPKLAGLLELESSAGLVEILKGEREAEEVLRQDPRSALCLIPGSARVSQPTRLLGPQAMGVLLDEARRHFDLVLIDSPPVLAVTDARVMAPMCDELVMLVRWNATKRALVAHALAELETAAKPVLGTVLTLADPAAATPLGAADSRLVRRALAKYYAES